MLQVPRWGDALRGAAGEDAAASGTGTAEGWSDVRILKSIALLSCATAAAVVLGRYGIHLGGEGRNFAW